MENIYNMTPLMKQYWNIKSLHKDKILFFRMGDFYEMFAEDAETVAPLLNIVLTSRNKKSAQSVKMCGIPYHSISGPISKLLSAGFKIAICDQIGEVTASKTLMERKVTRILTPGMVYDPDSLNSLKAHYLCAFDEYSVSFVDVSTGSAFFYSISDEENKRRVINLLSPAEIVLTSQQKEQCFSQKEWNRFPMSVCDKEDGVGEDGSLPPIFNKGSQKGSLPSKKEGLSYSTLPVSACRLLAYIHGNQNVIIKKTLRPFCKKDFGKIMQLSAQVLDHLEVFKTYKGDVKDTLFAAVNRTQTPSGARLLRSRLREPCTDLSELENRLDQVESRMNDPDRIEEIRHLLARVGDIERRLGKLSQTQYSSKDLLMLAHSLKAAGEAVSLSIQASWIQKYTDLSQIVSLTQNLSDQINHTICLNVSSDNRLSSGSVIGRGVSQELDLLIDQVEKKQFELHQLENQERVKSGISSLKIRYNNVFGYYIEVTKLHSSKVPSHYIRKQTLTQAERYTTPQLQVIEGEVLSARTRRMELEKQIFESLRQKLLEYLPDLFYLSRVICEMDVSISLAYLAIERSYTRPRFSSKGELILINSRHPVVEQTPGTTFVSNTVHVKAGECMLLTGPNMAGKSTLMRQVALNVILAQAGCFVPSQNALLPVFTKLFTRVGASDSLSQGLSTFMVEMKESADILQKSDERSLVILDEIGRGTATYDGMSLAQAMVEYLVLRKKSCVFFATHYRELTVLEQKIPQVQNFHLDVKESNGQISFLYTLSKGYAKESYGVHVAALAGFPPSVIMRAQQLLLDREQNNPQQLVT